MFADYSCIALTHWGIGHILHNHFIENIDLIFRWRMTKFVVARDHNIHEVTSMHIRSWWPYIFCMAVGHKIHEVTDKYVK